MCSRALFVLLVPAGVRLASLTLVGARFWCLRGCLLSLLPSSVRWFGSCACMSYPLPLAGTCFWCLRGCFLHLSPLVGTWGWFLRGCFLYLLPLVGACFWFLCGAFLHLSPLVDAWGWFLCRCSWHLLPLISARSWCLRGGLMPIASPRQGAEFSQHAGVRGPHPSGGSRGPSLRADSPSDTAVRSACRSAASDVPSHDQGGETALRGGPLRRRTARPQTFLSCPFLLP